LAYDTDPSARRWLAAAGSAGGEWSPDGDKLMYELPTAAGVGIYIDSLDGTDPVQVPLPTSALTPNWAPDGERIAYYTRTGDTRDIWVVNIDGSDAHPVAASPDYDEVAPKWSPDGLWIAYGVRPWPEDGQAVRVVRYDGSDDHRLLATGVVGYPGYTVDLSSPAWKPDGSQLAVMFGAAGPGADPATWPDGDHIWGIGTIAPEGGLITPVFLSPPHAICCSQPWNPLWSPDGKSIVFRSAHHLADPAEWSFEPRTELFIVEVEADGSGEPVRLTYDCSLNDPGSWWAPNTEPPSEPGEPVSVTKGDTTVTFETVEGAGSTTVCVTDEPPGPTPSGFVFLGDYYDIATTAAIAGPISICMTYDEADIPTGSSEADLCILHYVEDGDYWEDITVSRDPDTNVVCGESTSLSVFTLAAGPATRFPDVPSHGIGEYGIDPHWAFYEVDACAQNGVVGGYADGSYQPTWQVTRGQMAVFIARALVAPDGDAGLESWTAPPVPTFPDVDTGFWAYKHVEYLKSLKVVGGYDDGLYRPTATVTRDQMAAYISRAIADPKGDEGLTGFTPPATPTFPDVPEGQWAYTYIEYAAANGVVQGYPYPDPEDSDATIYRYLPDVIVTRSQMAVYVARAFALMP